MAKKKMMALIKQSALEQAKSIEDVRRMQMGVISDLTKDSTSLLNLGLTAKRARRRK